MFHNCYHYYNGHNQLSQRKALMSFSQIQWPTIWCGCNSLRLKCGPIISCRSMRDIKRGAMFVMIFCSPNVNPQIRILIYGKIWCISLFVSELNLSCDPRHNRTAHSDTLIWTLWSRDKMNSISQPTFLNALSWDKMYEFQVRFYQSLFLKVQQTIFKHWFR